MGDRNMELLKRLNRKYPVGARVAYTGGRQPGGTVVQATEYHHHDRGHIHIAGGSAFTAGRNTYIAVRWDSGYFGCQTEQNLTVTDCRRGR